MDAQKNNFIDALKQEYPEFSFLKSQRFKWKYPKSIYFEENEAIPFDFFALQTLHELGHALSHHKDYKTDVERLKLESEAWQRAKREISAHPNWKIDYDEDFAETALDSYRDWLHQRSKCRKCGLTRFQTADGKYHCPKCDLF